MTFQEYTRQIDAEIQHIINKFESERLERLKHQESKKQKGEKDQCYAR